MKDWLQQDAVRLRALEPEDLELVYQMENDTTMWLHGCNTVPFSRFTIRQYLADNRNDLYQDGQLRLVIERDGVGVGLLDLCNLDIRNRRAEVSIALLAPHRHQGTGVIALHLLADYARSLGMLHSLYAIVAQSNQPAQHLFASAGYTQQGHLIQWLATPDQTYADAILFQQLL